MQRSADQILKTCFVALFPGVKRLQQQRDQYAHAVAQQERMLLHGEAALREQERAHDRRLRDAAAKANEALAQAQRLETRYRAYVDTAAAVLQYREAYFEAHGHVAPDAALPSARAWPSAAPGLSYEQKLLGMLDLEAGTGVELGPLQIPITSKSTSNVLYVDHLDTTGLREKYPTIEGLVDIDRPIVNGSLADTLEGDAPLDYLVASQVFEHVANPIRWVQDIAAVLRVGGRLSLSLPDRRTTFDLLREETHAADMVAAYLEAATVPNLRSVYEHHAQTTLVNMHWARAGAVTPAEVVSGRGATKAPKITADHMAMVGLAEGGEYLDVHAWVFTPPSFLIVMAQLAGDGFLPFFLRQFYPTNPPPGDRGSFSFTAVLEKPPANMLPAEIRRTFLQPLGD